MFEINWYIKLMMRFTPKAFLRFMAKKQGLDSRKINYANKLFMDAKRIDIQPLSSGDGRGFIIFLDNQLSLYFYQDGDHFYFDGFEMGEYENGDVRVFDNLNL